MAACIAFAISAGLLAVIVGGGIADARGRPRRRAGGRESGAEKSKAVWSGWVEVVVMANSGYEKGMGGHQGTAMHTACAWLYPDPFVFNREKTKVRFVRKFTRVKIGTTDLGRCHSAEPSPAIAEGRSVRCGLAV